MTDQRTRFQRLMRAWEADCPALTMIRARRFITRFPKHGPAWQLLGIVLTEMARYEEAEQALAKAIDYCPAEKLWMPLLRMGDLFDRQGDYEQAADWYRRVIEAAPNDATGYIHLGAVMAKRGRLHEAEEIHRRGTNCIEGCVDEAFLNLGLLLRALERYQEAADCFREAIQRDPGYTVAKKALRDVTACLRRTRRQ